MSVNRRGDCVHCQELFAAIERQPSRRPISVSDVVYSVLAIALLAILCLPFLYIFTLGGLP